MNPLVVVAALLLAPVVVDAVRRPTFRRLAVRNVGRRKGEALLVVLGSLLGTAIITASFVVGDTFDASLRDLGRTRFGPVDERVRQSGLDGFDDLVADVAADPVPGTDGSLPVVSAAAAVATVGGERRAEPEASIAEMDFDLARAFGRDADATGLAGAGATPGGSEAVVNERLARTLRVTAGDEVEVFAYGQSRRYRVRAVVPEVGLAGYASVLVPPGTVAELWAASTAADAAPPTAEVVVSNVGGVFDGAAGTEAVVAALQARVADRDGVEVEAVKQELLAAAEEEGRSIGELFTGIGGFSVIAGILLLVNLFVMLAEERKVELGMLRAVGLRRGHLMRTFASEGAVYAVGASVLGCLAGVGVGWVIVEVTAGIVAADDPDLVFRLAVDRDSLMAGAGVGLVISLLTVWATSFRISRLNVIRAIRDLPEPRTARQRVRALVLGAAGVVAGGFLTAGGIGGGDPYGTLAGPPLVLFSAIPLLSRFLPRRAVVVAAALLALAWSVGVYGLVPDSMEGSDIPVFVLQGVISVAAAVTVVSSLDTVWMALADRLSSSGRGLAARLGLAYPLARRFRTGMLLGMYSLVIFTITFLSVFSSIFGAQAPQFTDEIRAGYDLFVESNRGNPADAELLAAQPEVEGVAPLLVGYPDFTAPYQPEPTTWRLTGFDRSLLDRGQPVLSSRLPQYTDDRAVFEAVLADPSLVVVSDLFLQDGGGPPTARMEPGDTVGVVDRPSGRREQLTVAGVLSSDWLETGALVGATFARDLLGEGAVADRAFVAVAVAVAVAGGTDPDEAAAALTGRLLANGVDAESFASVVEGELAEQQGFFRLMQGYLGLGLLIGIAGLGVVMVRAVRERRRQVGMLRAMGFSSGVVRRAFLLEAAFVAVQGIVVGIGLGLVTAYQVLVSSDTFGETETAFSMPWTALAVILVLPLLASLVATAAPAAQAAAITPAVALRIAD